MGEKPVVPVDITECCGCGACVEICPEAAISMRQDAEGFWFPHVDGTHCVRCGLCRENCAFSNRVVETRPKEMPFCYIAKHHDTKVRMNSRSGGVFVACSDMVLQQGGVVYGCVLNDQMEAVHIRADNADERNRMCKSKYVQSNTIGIFPRVQSDLESGLPVLFSGTGCQVDGLLAYLNHCKIDLTGLYTLDIVCHGCASPLLFRDYIGWLEEKYHGKITAFEFRDKTARGWDGHVESVIIKEKKHVEIGWREIFHTDLSIRNACYHCKYSTVKHPADITIADAWGIQQAKPEFNDNRGVSMVLVNSTKGDMLLQAIQAACEVEKLPLEGPLYQRRLHSPLTPKGDRKAFWDAYFNGGIERLLKIYGRKSILYRVGVRAKYLARQILQGRRYYLP